MKQLTLTIVAALWAGVACGAVDIPSEKGFDASEVPAYGGEHTRIYAHVDAHQAEHLENLKRWVRQPSVSAQNIGIEEMANLLASDLTDLGFAEVALVPTEGHPGVWGYYDAGADKTLAVYMMYDVQPVEPQDWQVPPFEGAMVDHELGRVLMARAATNQKGPQRALLNAMSSIRAVTGTLPVNVMVIAEGEEELGSPHFPQIVAKYAERLRRAAGVFFPSMGQTRTGDVGMRLGVKGIVYFELEATGAKSGGPRSAEIHSSLKAISDAPAWRLIHALASLTTPDGNSITVPHYYDAIRPPSEEEAWVFNGAVERWKKTESDMRNSLDVSRWIDGMEGRESLASYLFGTTLNIDGIWGGYSGPGTKTILPHKVTAKLDSRLVPGQTPDQALGLIRAHLDENGFGDITVRKLAGYSPAQTSVDAPFVRAAIGTFNKYGEPPLVSVRSAGSAPYFVFTDLGLPMVSAGMGHGSGAHAPNEFIVIEPKPGSRIASLAKIEKFYVDMLYALAQAQ